MHRLIMGAVSVGVLACQGTIYDPSGVGDRGGDTTGGGGIGGGRPGDPGGMTENPNLVAIATKYFPGTSAAAPAKRMYRLTRTQLDVTTKTLLPAQYLTTAVATLPRDPLQTNYEYSDNLSFNDANFTPYTTWISQMVTGVKAAPQGIIDCAASGNSPTCLADQAEKFVRKAFRGAVSDAQLASYVNFFTTSASQVGLPAAVADLVDVTLTSPNYVFRDEVLTDPSSSLLPAELLQNVTYTLADAPPEAVGISSLTPALYVQTPDGLQKTIDQVLATDEARAKLNRFFLAWLEVKEPDEFTIAASTFPEFTPEVAAAVVAETKAFLERQLATASPTMKDLTEVNKALVSQAEAFLYGDNGSAPAPGLIDLDPTKRLGIFTQPAVLASHSGPTTTRLVKRGVFFTRKVMCMTLGNPPPDVDTTIPPTAGATERQRVESVTTPARCQGCHAVINPFGFMQENFDAIGRWRTLDDGTPIDESISVTFLDEGNLSTNSPVDALRGFTRSYRFQQCFARQLFRFYMGRDETPGDDPLLRQMFFDFAHDDKQEIIGMLHTLASAPMFARRTEAP